jgi:uncharacterized protein (TIGR03437 family)
VFDSAVGVIQAYSNTGTYRISASGLGFITSQVVTGGKVWGTVSQGGIFIGSSTEDGFNDMFVAAKLPASVPNTASLNGSYAIAELNLPGLNAADLRDAMFRINPNGVGNLGIVNANGYIGNLNTNVTQTITGPTYSINSTTGLGTLTYGGTLTSSNLLAGSRLFYISPDKRFIFGGSISGFDIFVGVLAPPTTTAPPDLLSGLYYQAGMDDDFTNLSAGFSSLSSYYGAFQATAGTIIGHQRLLNGFDGILNDYTAFDYTYSDTFSVNPDATMTDFFGQHHVVGAGGDMRIGIGTGFAPGINVAMRAPVFTGSGIFLNPTGVINLFSSAPFSVGLSPGAFMVLTGTGLADVKTVLVNGRQAYIYSATDTAVIVVAPYATSGSAASIQAFNSVGASSSILTVFATTTTPGVLADRGGAGHVIAQHLDYSLVTVTNPALPGEIILFYVDGLGTVSPAVADGVPAPLSPLSPVVTNLAARIDGENATILFAGLTPTLVSDYAFIVVIPTDTLPGDAFLDVSGPDSFTSEATIPVGSLTPSGEFIEGSGQVTPPPAAPTNRAPRLGRPPRPVPPTVQALSGPVVASPLGVATPARQIAGGNPVGR